ncbi:MAG: ACP S-malonyltransferase [Firmicutes bacterium]|nr:ACP S-malonyltransferase [Bacillota bacterium]
MSAWRVAAVFPGQGAQFVGMGRAAYEAFPEVRDIFERADRALGFSITRLCFEGPAEELQRTEITQPAILTVSCALYAVLAARGFRPDVTAGLSLGEYSAAVAAGALDFEDAVRLVRRRGRYMQEAVPEGRGAMAAILGLPDEVVEAVCAEAAAGETVRAANYNCPGQVVISGTRAAVERAVALARERGARRAVALPVSAPFHCELMRPAAARLAPELKALPWREPTCPVVANVDAQPRATADGLREALLRQVEAPVRWSQSVREMADRGVRLFVEIGPGTALTGFVRRIAPEAEAVSCQGPEDLGNVFASISGGLLK